MRPSRAFCALGMAGILGCLCLRLPAFASDKQPLKGLSASVDVYFDPHGVPHIYAQTWPDAARVLGYLHARDRLWQMDLFRRRASGQLAEVLGPEHVESDILMRRLGIRTACATVWKSEALPEALRAELTA